MIQINSKSQIVDGNINLCMTSLGSNIEDSIFLTVQSSYVLRMTVYDYISQSPNTTSITPVVKHFDPSDRFRAVLGNQVLTSQPLVTVHNSLFNDISYWDDVDPANGKICFKLNLNSHNLLTDISGLARKNYVLQVWCFDVVTNLPYLISSNNITINNVVVEL